MEYVKLGYSDLRVSRICLGCMGFGDPTIGQHAWTIGEEPTREIIRRSLNLGVNFFDTAIAYQLGTSEQYVGRALRDMARREDVVVATKFLPRRDEEIAAGIGGRQHVMNVTFGPRCRNNWHIHHKQVQVLICVAGRGWYQEWGKEPMEMTPGTVIAIPAEVKHWHGAAKDSWFQHLTYHKDVQDGASNEWLELVTDEIYNKLQ